MVWYKGILAASSTFGGDRELWQDLQKLPERTERTNLFESTGNSINRTMESRLERFGGLNTVYSPDVRFVLLRGRNGGANFHRQLRCAQATARSAISLTWTLPILLVEISRILDNS